MHHRILILCLCVCSIIMGWECAQFHTEKMVNNASTELCLQSSSQNPSDSSQTANTQQDGGQGESSEQEQKEKRSETNEFLDVSDHILQHAKFDATLCFFHHHHTTTSLVILEQPFQPPESLLS